MIFYLVITFFIVIFVISNETFIYVIYVKFIKENKKYFYKLFNVFL